MWCARLRSAALGRGAKRVLAAGGARPQHPEPPATTLPLQGKLDAQKFPVALEAAGIKQDLSVELSHLLW